MSTPAIAILYTTLPSHEAAQPLARILLTERLAACCNILPAMESLYWWEGAITAAPEVVLLCKTTDALAPTLAARIAALHPYTCPAILTLPASANAPFATWVAQETAPA